MENKNGTPQAAKDQAQAYDKLRQALAPFSAIMRKASDAVLDQEISKYPIFVIHQMDSLELGIPIIGPSIEQQFDYIVHISTLEEFTAKKIIDIARVDRFRQVYKDPKEHFCLFLFKKGEANFVFL